MICANHKDCIWFSCISMVKQNKLTTWLFSNHLVDCVGWLFFRFWFVLCWNLYFTEVQPGRRNLPWPGCRQLGGECCAVVLAVSCAGHGEPRAWGGRERHNAGEPVAGWRQRDCWGKQGANSLVFRMLKRKTFCKDLEGTAKSFLQFKHPEEASGLRARLEQRVCLQGRRGTGVGWLGILTIFCILISRL